jgi:hypothetical protein
VRQRCQHGVAQLDHSSHVMLLNVLFAPGRNAAKFCTFHWTGTEYTTEATVIDVFQRVRLTLFAGSMSWVPVQLTPLIILFPMHVPYCDHPKSPPAKGAPNGLHTPLSSVLPTCR